ncbi:hypothetical protein DUI87_31344 [Hirundo rustica rustica]|uniref:Uncharacterized protein n=1 Tax=Hirundo rustica rustica TaxID=333673 RepID=A0A3M0IZQ5_HIRRU|nr:hypothetical protein DUI87_31344 [Hirundo rustica rustica]
MASFLSIPNFHGPGIISDPIIPDLEGLSKVRNGEEEEERERAHYRLKTRRQISRGADETPDPGRGNPEWCGEWGEMGQLLKEFSDPVVWDFPWEQIQNPVELGKYLKERYHDGSKGERIAAVSWALAYAYRTLLETVGQQTEAGGKGYKSTATPVTRATANTPVMEPAAKLEPEPELAAKADSKPKPWQLLWQRSTQSKLIDQWTMMTQEKDLHQNQKPKLLAQDQKRILIPFP